MTALPAGRATGARPVASHNHDINVTPFVDVMLVLLIVFIIAAPLATTAIKVDMPPISPFHPPTGPPTVVWLERDGALTVSWGSAQGRRTQLDQLLRVLYATPAGRDPAEHEVLVGAAPGVKYGAFFSVLNRLHGAGYSPVGLVSERPDA